MKLRPNDPRRPLSTALARALSLPDGRLTSWLRVGLLCLVVPAAACTSWQGTAGSARITTDDLLQGDSLRVAKDSPVLVVDEQDVLALSGAMEQFLDANVDLNASDEPKLRQLVSAIIETETFGSVYDDKTRTASETFRVRQGNCLSFSNMFVSMARRVGLRAEYQEVQVPPDWTLDNDTFVLNQHVNVYVDLGKAGTRVVDFNIGDFKTSYEMRKISDKRALAHYFNNIGVERMQAGDTASALGCFRKAIADADWQFSPAWTNLGTLYMRHGDRARAEAAYLQALEADYQDLVAMSNLSRLYERAGDRERADAYRKKVIHHRMLNPYYRYDLARQAYAAQKYDEAIGNLKYSIRKRPKEDEFYFLLALSYYQKGDVHNAQRWLLKAEEVAATSTLRDKYSSKVDTLLRRGDH